VLKHDPHAPRICDIDRALAIADQQIRDLTVEESDNRCGVSNRLELCVVN